MALGLILIILAVFLTGYNFWDENRAQGTAEQALHQLQCLQPENSDYAFRSDMEMPTARIDNKQYIGIIQIPALSLLLPVISEWSTSDLKCAPCRYSGSAYSDDMILAGHNYHSHFGNLKYLTPGDLILFTDMAGNTFSYKVTETEVLDGTAVDEMESGDWDLTLFTCTIGGASRVTVRCVRKFSQN